MNLVPEKARAFTNAPPAIIARLAMFQFYLNACVIFDKILSHPRPSLLRPPVVVNKVGAAGDDRVFACGVHGGLFSACVVHGGFNDGKDYAEP